MSLMPEFFGKTEEERKFILKGLSIEDKSLLKKYLDLNDCIFFGETYIKPYDKKWTSETAYFHYELIDTILKYERLQVHIPFEHAKTT